MIWFGLFCFVFLANKPSPFTPIRWKILCWVLKFPLPIKLIALWWECVWVCVCVLVITYTQHNNNPKNIPPSNSSTRQGKGVVSWKGDFLFFFKKKRSQHTPTVNDFVCLRVYWNDLRLFFFLDVRRQYRCFDYCCIQRSQGRSYTKGGKLVTQPRSYEDYYFKQHDILIKARISSIGLVLFLFVCLFVCLSQPNKPTLKPPTFFLKKGSSMAISWDSVWLVNRLYIANGVHDVSELFPSHLRMISWLLEGERGGVTPLFLL